MPAAAVDNNDYADSVVGTYKGPQTVYQSDNSTLEDYNATATVVVTKISKNVVGVKFDGPHGGDYFDLTNQNGHVHLKPENATEYGSTYNTYNYSSKGIVIYVKDGNPWYYYFQGTKQ